MMMVRAVVLLAIVLLAAVAPTLSRVPRRCGAVLLTLLSLWWLNLDSAMEGGVLVTLTPGHGIVVADFVTVAGVIAAVFAWLRPSPM